MARTSIRGYGPQVAATRMKSAVVWVRGFALDFGTEAARVDATQRGCREIELKNENMYDQIPDPVQDFDYCYTDDPYIKADYERAGITVIELGPKENPDASNDDPEEPVVPVAARKKLTLDNQRSTAA